MKKIIVEIEYLEDIRITTRVIFSVALSDDADTSRYISGTPIPDRSGSGWSPDTDEVPDASQITPPQVATSTGHRISLHAEIDAGMPLEIIASRYHPVDITEKAGRYAVKLALPEVPMDHDFELLWRPVPSARPRAMAFRETQNGKPYYLLMVVPPTQALVPATAIPRETIFIVDTSGSMHGVSISQAKRAVKLALDGLNPGDLFNVIAFNSTFRPLFSKSEIANTRNLEFAQAFVENLVANGGTEMRPALSFALDSAPSEQHLRQVVFITDGSVGYEDELFSMIEQKIGDTRLFTVGIGSAPNSWFMRKVAQAGKGSYTLISALHEVQEKMDKLFQKLRQPQLTDIEVRWPSGIAANSYPVNVPDLYAGEPVTVKAEITGKLKRRDTVTIAGNSVGGAWQAELPLRTRKTSPGVAALWARSRIDALMDIERRSPDPAEVRDRIVNTAIDHHLVSKYTSLVAVDKTPARHTADPLKKEQIPNLLPYGQSGNAIFGFPATATGAPLLRITGFMTLVFGLVLALRGPRRA